MWGVKLTGPWGKMEALLRDAPRAVDREIARATRFNAMKVVRAIRKNIQEGEHTKNAELTVLLKGSSKPLVNKGELYKSITYKVVSAYRAEVGVLRTSSTVNTALVVHEGATIKVTDAMRGLFHAIARYSVGELEYSELGKRAQELADGLKFGTKRGRDKRTGRFKSVKVGFAPLKASTTRIKIPGRPFMREVIEDPVLQMQVMENWARAVTYAIAGRKAPPLV